MAILRSLTIFRFRRLCLKELSQKVLHANQHRTEGVAGERIDKSTGEIEVSNKVKKVRGALYSNRIIQECTREITSLTSLATPSHVRRRIVSRISSSENTYKVKKTTEAVAAYQKNLTETPLRAPNNSAVNKTGYDTTDHMNGRMPYSSLRIPHIHLVQAEITFRCGNFDPKEKIRALEKRLKEMDKKQQRETYKEKNGVDARDSDLNQNVSSH